MANQKQLNQMMRQMQKMQADMAAAQEALANETIEAGAGELVSVSISPEVVDPDDVEMLEDLVVAAVSEAMRQAQQRQGERLGGVTGGVDLGALGGLLG